MNVNPKCMKCLKEWVLNVIEYFNMFLLLVSSIGMHEWGHYTYMHYVLGKDIKITFHNKKFYVGEFKDYIDMTARQKYSLYLMGILFGAVPTIFYGLMFNVLYYVILPVYLFGCRDDLRRMWRLMHVR